MQCLEEGTFCSWAGDPSIRRTNSPMFSILLNPFHAPRERLPQGYSPSPTTGHTMVFHRAVTGLIQSPGLPVSELLVLGRCWMRGIDREGSRAGSTLLKGNWVMLPFCLLSLCPWIVHFSALGEWHSFSYDSHHNFAFSLVARRWQHWVQVPSSPQLAKTLHPKFDPSSLCLATRSWSSGLLPQPHAPAPRLAHINVLHPCCALWPNSAVLCYELSALALQ